MDSEINNNEVLNQEHKNEMYWEGEFLIVKTRRGKTYKFEEQNESVLSDARKVATMQKRDRNGNVTPELNEELMFTKMLVGSCVEPKLIESEFDLNALKGSEAMLLRKALFKLYDLDSFL